MNSMLQKPETPTKRQRSPGIRYDTAVHPRVAEGLALMGYLDTEIAAHIGISTSTIYRWKAAHCEFREAITRGRIPVDIEVTKALRLSAIGGLITEEKAFKVRDGEGNEDIKVVEVKRYVEGDVRAQQLWLTNRQRAHWKVYKQVESSGLDGAPVQHEVTSKGIEAALIRITELFGSKG